MSKKPEGKEEVQGRKLWSRIADWVLGVLVVLLLFLQIDIIITSRRNYGIPQLFGKSFMQILTNSMDGPEDDTLFLTYQKASHLDESKEVDPLTETRPVLEVYPIGHEAMDTLKHNFDYGYLIKRGPKFLHVDTGIIIQTIEFKDIVPGDVITFVDDISINGQVFYNQPTSHRVIEIDYEKETLSCFGDNNMPYDGSRVAYYSDPTQRNDITKKDILGLVIYSNDGLGALLGAVQSTWFLPVMIITPLGIIGILSAVEAIHKGHQERKKEKMELAAAIEAAGIDKNDEVAMEVFVTRYQAKREMQQELEKEKERQKEIFREAYEAEKKRLRKENKSSDDADLLEKIKQEEKTRIRAELANGSSKAMTPEEEEKQKLIAKIKEEEKARLRAEMAMQAPSKEEEEKAKLIQKIKEEEKARLKAEMAKEAKKPSPEEEEKQKLIEKIKEEEKAKLRAQMAKKEKKLSPEEEEKRKLIEKLKEEEKAKIKAEMKRQMEREKEADEKQALLEKMKEEEKARLKAELLNDGGK